MITEVFPDTTGAMRTWLRAQTAISALVGTRVYVFGIPTDTAYPFIVVTPIAGSDDSSTAPIDNAVLQFQVWAHDVLSATAVLRALRSVLFGIQGTTALDANTRCFGAEIDLVSYSPDPVSRKSRFIVTSRVTAIAV